MRQGDLLITASNLTSNAPFSPLPYGDDSTAGRAASCHRCSYPMEPRGWPFGATPVSKGLGDSYAWRHLW